MKLLKLITIAVCLLIFASIVSAGEKVEKRYFKMHDGTIYSGEVLPSSYTTYKIRQENGEIIVMQISDIAESWKDAQSSDSDTNVSAQDSSGGVTTIQKEQTSRYNLSNEKFQYDIRVQTGYMTGTANEIVYADSDSDNLLSQLIWEIDELFMVGFGASVQHKWFAFHADAWFKATDGEGTMDDYDWLSGGPGWSHWSHHEDTTVSEAWIIDLNCELMIPQLSTGSFVTSAIIGYKYENYEWQARGGSYIYSSNPGWRDLIGTIPAGQLSITYSQTWGAPYIGFGLRGSFGKFELSGRAIGTTYAKVNTHDTHHLRGMNTVAEMNDGKMYSLGLTGGYHFTGHLALNISYLKTQYDTLRGDSTYTGSDGTSTTFSNNGGADLETDMISLALSYSF
jgi:plasminogen activator